jgi:hypothetical protein
VKIREEVVKDPFTWPIMATVDTFKTLLRKGNKRPSPGPDHWEKWVVRALSDKALEVVTNLFKYVLMNNYFRCTEKH